MSEFDREEAAFREAFTHQAMNAPPLPIPQLSRRRWWVPVLAAATVVAVIGVTFAVLNDEDGKRRLTSTGRSPTPSVLGFGAQWIGIRGVEVKAPGSWAFGLPALRPDCIQDEPGEEEDLWARDVPKAPYVTVGGDDRPVPLVGCFGDPVPGDPDPAFGALPFRFWQPYVQVVAARPDLKRPDRANGEFSYRGWTLSRTTISGVQVTVLAAPDAKGLGAAVIASAREVRTTHDGCAAGSDVLAERSRRPAGAPIPATGVAAVTICNYTRDNDGIGLSGSRRIVGPAAADLATAIHKAPAGVGPQDPAACTAHQPVEEALVLRFYGITGDVSHPLADAYVYFDYCVGNAIVDSNGPRNLTTANCKPLFAAPPIQMGAAWSPVFKLCATTTWP